MEVQGLMLEVGNQKVECRDVLDSTIFRSDLAWGLG